MSGDGVRAQGREGSGATAVGAGATVVHEVPSSLRERKQARTRAQLTEAADRLFASRGFGAVTVEDICAEVDVSPRTFFRYFHSKEDVVFDGIQPCLEQTVAAFAGRPSSEDAYESLSRALLSVASDAGSERELLRVHLLVRSSPELLGPSLEQFRALQDELVELMTTRAPGACTHPVARLLTAVAFAAFASTLDEWAVHPDRPLASQLAHALGAVRDGVRGIVRLGDDGAGQPRPRPRPKGTAGRGPGERARRTSGPSAASA